MTDKLFSDIGRDLSDSVQDALVTGDFSRLKWTISDTMHTVIDSTLTPKPNAAPAASQPAPAAPKAAPAPQSAPVSRPASPVISYVPDYPKKFSAWQSTLMQILGLVGAIPLGIASAALLILLFSNGFAAGLLVAFAIVVALFAFFVVLTARGFRERGRIDRYKLCWDMLRGKNYCEISALAEATNKSPRFLVREIAGMSRQGMLPGVRMDKEKTCLMLGDEIYQRYLDAQKSLEERRTREEKNKDNAELQEVVAAGRDWVRQIKEANDALPGAVISEKLSRLEDVTTRIFGYVEQRPQKLPEIRRFMNYYLPVTVKLVKSYLELDSQPAQGEKAEASKREIEETLDTINTAFSTLLDRLGEDDAMDISTDISALKAVLTQEGLVGDDFHK